MRDDHAIVHHRVLPLRLPSCISCGLPAGRGPLFREAFPGSKAGAAVAAGLGRWAQGTGAAAAGARTTAGRGLALQRSKWEGKNLQPSAASIDKPCLAAHFAGKFEGHTSLPTQPAIQGSQNPSQTLTPNPLLACVRQLLRRSEWRAR